MLTGTVVSPTLGHQLKMLLEQFPQAQWHQYEPLNHDNALAGNRLAFGEDVVTLAHVEQADVILSLDADFLVEGPGHLQHARGFAARRRLSQPDANGRSAMNRLYVVESTTTLTGAAADNRLPMSPRGVAQFALACARELGLETSVDNPAASRHIPSAMAYSSGRRFAGRARPKSRDGRAKPAARRPRAGTLDQSDSRQRRHNGRIPGADRGPTRTSR